MARATRPPAKEPEKPIAVLLASADRSKRARPTAKQCQACHTFEKGGPNRVGPNLWNIVGDERGKDRGGFNFSAAMKAKGGEWTFEELNKFLARSARLYPRHQHDLRRPVARPAARRRDRLPAHAVGQSGAAAEGGGSRGRGAGAKPPDAKPAEAPKLQRRASSRNGNLEPKRPGQKPGRFAFARAGVRRSATEI